MAGLIQAVTRHRIASVAELAGREKRSPYEALARAIAHQQLNGKAAQSILSRLTGLYGQRFPTPEELLAANKQQLRGVGFSFAKIAALQDLAAKTLEGIVPVASALESLSDLEIIERLTAVRGIGRWTVEMMLMFELRRPDILPVDDFGVRTGFRLAYGLRDLPLPRALAEFGELDKGGLLPRCSQSPRLAIRKLARRVAPLTRQLHKPTAGKRGAGKRA